MLKGHPFEHGAAYKDDEPNPDDGEIALVRRHRHGLCRLRARYRAQRRASCGRADRQRELRRVQAPSRACAGRPSGHRRAGPAGRRGGGLRCASSDTGRGNDRPRRNGRQPAGKDLLVAAVDGQPEARGCGGGGCTAGGGMAAWATRGTWRTAGSGGSSLPHRVARLANGASVAAAAPRVPGRHRARRRLRRALRVPLARARANARHQSPHDYRGSRRGRYQPVGGGRGGSVPVWSWRGTGRTDGGPHAQLPARTCGAVPQGRHA